jgi:prepilin-type N-terminal cleavage/methylation domain-containing protein
MKTKGGLSRQMKSNAGFTLVELMVVAAILGILVVGSMQFMANQQRSIKTAELKGDLATARNLIASWLESKSICEATLSGMQNNSTQPITRIISQAADNEASPPIPERVEYALGQRIPTTSWTVNTLDLLSKDEAQAVTSSISGDQDGHGVATVLIRAVLQQVKGVNTLVTATEDRGNYASVTKELYFPIRVRMAELLPQTTQEDSNSIANHFINAGMPDCSWTGAPAQPFVLNGTQYTTNALYLEALGADGTTQFDPKPETERVVPTPTGFIHIASCWAYSPNLAINECIPAGSNAGL